MVVEVAESSLRYDQTVKLPLYAGAGVPEYWIVSVEGEWIEVCRSPAGERYRERSRAARGDVIVPVAFPDVRISVDDSRTCHSLNTSRPSVVLISAFGVATV